MKKRTIQKWLRKASKITALLLVMGATQIEAQNIGISPTGAAPDNSAGLDVRFSDKGMLIPRVSLSDVSVYNPPITAGTNARSLLVYNTNTAVVGGNGEGFYYWDSVAVRWKYIAAPGNGPGAAGQVLVSQGSGNPPQWSTLSVSGGCAGSVQMISNVSASTMNWRSCANYCATLTEGGYSDWRMPTTQDIVSYMSNWDNVKNSSGVLLSSQPAFPGYIWVGEFYYPSDGFWVVFYESAGSWYNFYFTDTYRCRCVR